LAAAILGATRAARCNAVVTIGKCAQKLACEILARGNFAQGQLDDIGRYPSRFILGHEIGRRAPARLFLIVDVSHRNAVRVLYDEARMLWSSNVQGGGKLRAGDIGR
jgi:hypothetical protein